MNFFKSEFIHLGRKRGGGAGNGSDNNEGSSSLSAGLFASVGVGHELQSRSAAEVHRLTSTVDPSVDLVSVYGDYVADPVCCLSFSLRAVVVCVVVCLLVLKCMCVLRRCMQYKVCFCCVRI
jgi:hypothetical protein